MVTKSAMSTVYCFMVMALIVFKTSESLKCYHCEGNDCATGSKDCGQCTGATCIFACKTTIKGGHYTKECLTQVGGTVKEGCTDALGWKQCLCLTDNCNGKGGGNGHRTGAPAPGAPTSDLHRKDRSTTSNAVKTIGSFVMTGVLVTLSRIEF